MDVNTNVKVESSRGYENTTTNIETNKDVLY